MQHISKGSVRRIRLRAVVAYPAVSTALVVSIALVLTPFGSPQSMALDVTPTSAGTSSPTATATADPTAAPTTAEPITAPPTTVATTTTLPTTAAPTTIEPTTTGPTTTTDAPGPVPSPTPGPIPTLTAAAGNAPVNHHVLAWIEDSAVPAAYLPVDAPALDASPFQTFRVRFQMHNPGTAPITATPRLEYRADGAAGFAVIPEKAQPGIALHVAREWIPASGLGGGTVQGPLGEDIAAGDLKMLSADGVAATGHHSMGANPDAPITLPAGSYTEEEFTVRLSIDAQYLTGYELRVTNAGAEFAGTAVARIVLGSPPPVQLSPGQRQGVVVVDPKPIDATGVAYPLASPLLAATSTTTVPEVLAVSSPSAALYPLDSGSLLPATVDASVTVAVVSAGTGSPHDMAAAQCGTCHRGHTAKGPGLLAQSEQSTLCFSCHASAGPGKDIKNPYDDTSVLTNDPVKREYFSHEAVVPAAMSKHTLDVDEFGGKLNRHSECADCHNSHKANSTDSIQSSDETGWDASGRLAGVSGVSVLNGVAGSAPTYTFLSGQDTNVVPANKVTREYQLCFKCHSGFTKLLPDIAGKPSTDALDKAVEFNPNNLSFHPVEAKGTNGTPKMDLSLAGSSPYKLWNFNVGSTIRCLNCHATSTTPNLPPPPTPSNSTLPQPGSALAPHTSANRGILLRSYRDRVLKSGTEDYAGMDFALCYVCHGEEPFSNKEGPSASAATNFNLHGLHLIGLKEDGSSSTAGTDIDKSGDGQGNAICAECHFRTHSTTSKVGEPGGSRLVKFAPNVQPNSVSEPIEWTPGTTSGGSCTLTCHGYKHSPERYGN